MKIRIDWQKCDLCGTCVAVCPVDCMELTETRLSIDHEICTRCELCIRVCPMQALAISDEEGA